MLHMALNILSAFFIASRDCTGVTPFLYEIRSEYKCIIPVRTINVLCLRLCNLKQDLQAYS